MRDWLVILGVLVVLVVLADGLRRMWLSRRKDNELSFGLEDIQGQVDDFSSELPNGGARLKNGHEIADDVQDAPVRTEPHLDAGLRVEPELPPLDSEPVNLNESVTAEVVATPQPASKPRNPKREAAVQKPEVTFDAEPASEPVQETPQVEAQPVVEKPKPQDSLVLPGQQALALDEPVPVLMDMDLRAEPDDALVKSRSLREKVRSRVKSSETFSLLADRKEEAEPEIEHQPELEPEESVDDDHPVSMETMEEVLVINVMAPEGRPFPGDRLMEIFKEHGLCFGDMNIFHRHVREDGSGQILFSVANGVEPGTFDLKTMESSFTPALSFFMGLPGPEQPQQAFRILVGAVHHLSRDLGGILRDEQHSVLTGQTLEHYRQRISDFERRHLAQRKKSTARA